MSLEDEKWNQYAAMMIPAIEEKAHVSTFWRARMRQAFGAGFVAGKVAGLKELGEVFEQAELDRLKGQK